MLIKTAIAGFLFITGVATLIWFVWLWFGFSQKVNTGKRITMGHYRKIRWQGGFLLFLSLSFTGISALISSGDIDFKIENLGLFLIGPVCFASFLTGIILLGFSQIRWGKKFIPDEEVE